eukprot:Transcript_23084.p1 GENE.Transcript_23084~~Transcript_23084.p1  ORF type:complete len:559 (+),score=189.27 Transcript_23084:94-1770(+)
MHSPASIGLTLGLSLSATAAALVALLLGGWPVSPSVVPGQAPEPPRLPPLFEAAPELAATPTLRSSAQLRAVVEARQPTLWRQSFVQDWAALAEWTPALLAEAVPWVTARSSASAEFVLSAPQRGNTAPLLTLQRNAELTHGRRNASVAELLTAPAPGPAEFLYYSGTLGDAPTAHWDTERLLAAVQPLAPLQIADVPPLTPDAKPQPPASSASSDLPRNRTTFRLWLSGAGVVSRTHYDKAHNLFAQIMGTKHLLLWPPSTIPSLHLYPAAHIAHRQSQMPLKPRAAGGDGGDREAAVAAAAAAAVSPSLPPLPAYAAVAPPVRVTLRPGELLYIPPYHMHAVASEGPSVSLASFSDSWEQARWARSVWLAAPLGRLSAGACPRARGAAGLVLALGHSLAKAGLTAAGAAGAAGAAVDAAAEPARTLVAELFASRYAPLYGAAAAAPREAAGAGAEQCERLEACLTAAAAEPGAAEADGALRARLRAHAEEVAALLTAPDGTWAARAYEASVARELAGDYIEELAGWACGPEGAWRLLRLLAAQREAALTRAAWDPD